MSCEPTHLIFTAPYLRQHKSDVTLASISLSWAINRFSGHESFWFPAQHSPSWWATYVSHLEPWWSICASISSLRPCVSAIPCTSLAQLECLSPDLGSSTRHYCFLFPLRLSRNTPLQAHQVEFTGGLSALMKYYLLGAGICPRLHFCRRASSCVRLLFCLFGRSRNSAARSGRCQTDRVKHESSRLCRSCKGDHSAPPHGGTTCVSHQSCPGTLSFSNRWGVRAATSLGF